MQQIKRDEFASRYMRILTRTSSNHEFSRRFGEDPRVVLAENGLETPAQATLEVVRDEDRALSLGPQCEL
jgi:hypothetical protein